MCGPVRGAWSGPGPRGSLFHALALSTWKQSLAMYQHQGPTLFRVQSALKNKNKGQCPRQGSVWGEAGHLAECRGQSLASTAPAVTHWPLLTPQSCCSSHLTRFPSPARENTPGMNSSFKRLLHWSLQPAILIAFKV